ncbi:MAG: hypothetical protein Q8L29_01345 [archaeon]|nr:hypothetical protein [archaeon]
MSEKEISDKFVPSKIAQKIMQMVESGELTGGRTYVIPMRDCDDVPKYIAKIYAAQERTAGSRLRFGPVDPEYDRRRCGAA